MEKEIFTVYILSTDWPLSTFIFFTDPPETKIQELHLRFNQRR